MDLAPSPTTLSSKQRQQERRRRSPPREPLPPCAVLFISGLPVGVPGAGWRRPLEKSFGRFSARGKPRVRIARNSLNNAVGHGWIENVLLDRASEAAAALDGKLTIEGQPVAVSLCIDRRDALCPRLGYAARRQLILVPPDVEGNPSEPLDQPTAERIAELLMLFAAVGSGRTGICDVGPPVQLLDICAGEGIGTAVFASTFATVHAVESDPQRFEALERNFSPARRQDDETGPGSLAVHTSGVRKVQLHRTLEDGIAAAASSGVTSLVPATPGAALFGFFQFETDTSPAQRASTCKDGDYTGWAKDKFFTLLGAGCEVVAALLPASVDFDSLAAALVQPTQSPETSTELPTDERPHPFKLEFLRPSYTAEEAPRSGLWRNWQLVLVTAALTSPCALSTHGQGTDGMSFGNARLDALVQALLGFYGKYGKEHRPFFYDWEKTRTIQLSRWKGAKLASDCNGLTLRELRAAQSEPETQSGSGDTAATTHLVREPECASSGVGMVLSTARQCRLVWVLVVEGGTCDRKTGSSRKASWVGFDKGYRLRRDALARSVTAALWENPASTADCVVPHATEQQTTNAQGPPRQVHGDSECHIIYEQTGELLSISSEFAQTWRQPGPPTEARLLKAFDDAARDANSPGGPGSTDKFVPGLTVHVDTTTVAEATARILQASGLDALLQKTSVEKEGHCAIIELHEDKERFLPVYSTLVAAEHAHKSQCASSAGGLLQLDALMMVLGCVQDHSAAVATVVETSLWASQPLDTTCSVCSSDIEGRGFRCNSGLHHLAVNVGPVSEFSSKVIHLLQAHHTAKRLLPAVVMQLQLQRGELPVTSAERDARDARTARLRKMTANGGGGGSAADVLDAGANDACDRFDTAYGEMTQSNPDSSLAGTNIHGPPKHYNQVPLHFWVWFDGVRLEHLPTTQECKRVANPCLASNHRSAVWRVPNVILAAFARSHGAYNDVTLSLVLEDAVITVDGTLITKHITKRGWGALTEHHTLVALRDAIDAASPRAPVLAKNFQNAIEQTINRNAAGNNPGRAASPGNGATQKNRFVLLTDEQRQCGPNLAFTERLYCQAAYEHVKVDADEHTQVESEKPAMQQDRYHFLLLPPSAHLDASEVEAAICNAHCTSAVLHVAACGTETLGSVDVGEPVRTIVALQAHNNCGVLAPAVDEIMAVDVDMQQ